jgi:putative radical SAM enzyme (TIGR03279 family)
MTDKDVARIVKMRFSPINVSVHTTNPELRVKMMKNKRSGEVLKYLSDFKNAGLSMCAQIVLCRGINDGEELRRTLLDLAEYFPSITSIAVVPAGLTKYRDKLYPLTDFSKKEAAAVIELVNSIGNKFKKKFGTRLVYLADEFYLKAEKKLPSTDYYEDYSQIENGVGMLRSFSDEFNIEIKDLRSMIKSQKRGRVVSVATGVASYPVISSLAKRLEKLSGGLTVHVYEIKNRFFGESITVSGLLTGRDIYAALEGKTLGDELFVPANALRYPEEDFLCGMKLLELSEKLGVKISCTGEDGFGFLEAVTGVHLE